ncbi:MAG: hypothetical protein HY22_03570 [[Candidatus Thermochlorobacteriaceae] bacterium GBChlB]|nr:MAG: hypothetical protein HY22_03570 [[Candidatus Thermochlorobacteriaceae] bacterium GBChlB]
MNRSLCAGKERTIGMTKSQGFLIGVLSFAAGVGIGLLLAPKSGRDLRKDIKRSATLSNLFEDLDFSTSSSREIERELSKRNS